MDNKQFVARLKTIRKLNSDNSFFINKDLYRLVISHPALINGYKRTTNKRTSTGFAETNVVLSDQQFLNSFDVKGTAQNSVLRLFEQLQQSLSNESYQPKPLKEKDREEITIGKAKTKPKQVRIQSNANLFTLTPEDKTVQFAVLMVLEAIYEPVFSVQSFGFRPNKNEHNALKDIESKYDGLSYAIKGEVENIYDTIDHHVLVGLLRKKIEDSRFISLIWKFLNAGHVNKKGFHASKLGIYKDSVLSPILVNIYLHELDMFMAPFVGCKQPVAQRSCVKSKKANRSKNLTPVAREHKNRIKVLSNKASKLEKGLQRDETLKQLKATKLKSIRCKTYVDPCDRLYYHRYVDHFIVGIAGSKEYALEIQELIRVKLNKLLVSLVIDKTKIVFLKKEKVNFLGYNIYIETSQKISKLHLKGKTPFLKGTTGWFVCLEAPMQDIVQKLAVKGFCNSNGFPTPNRSWSAMPDYQIVNLYNITFHGILTYYSGACHRHALGRLLYIFRYSCAMTLASKHRSSISKIFKEHGKQLFVVYGSRGEKQICFNEAKQFREKDKLWKTGIKLPDPYKEIHRRLTKTKIFESCSNCGSKDNVEMHHIHHVRKSKGNNFHQITGIINRKQIALCSLCHDKVHSGKYDGVALTKLAKTVEI